jgi:hypothetical protein
MIWVVALSCVGCGAMPWAYLNLVGVPMQERNSMDPVRGWISVAVAVVCLALAFWLDRISKQGEDETPRKLTVCGVSSRVWHGEWRRFCCPSG